MVPLNYDLNNTGKLNSFIFGLNNCGSYFAITTDLRRIGRIYDYIATRTSKGCL